MKGRGLLCCPCIKSYLKVDNSRSTNKLNWRVRGMADSLKLIDVINRQASGWYERNNCYRHLISLIYLLIRFFSIVVQMG